VTSYAGVESLIGCKIIGANRDLGDDSIQIDVEDELRQAKYRLYVDIGGPLDDAHLNVEVLPFVLTAPTRAQA
jgi:hypothetical protein